MRPDPVYLLRRLRISNKLLKCDVCVLYVIKLNISFYNLSKLY